MNGEEGVAKVISRSSTDSRKSKTKYGNVSCSHAGKFKKLSIQYGNSEKLVCARSTKFI
jgi:hypothetical protein